MFFNLETGEIADRMAGFVCWVADGNIWFANGDAENSINQVNFEKLCQFLEKSSESDDYADMQDGDFNFALEESELGSDDNWHRNVCFWGSSFWFCFSMRSDIISSWSEFLRTENKPS